MKLLQVRMDFRREIKAKKCNAYLCKQFFNKVRLVTSTNAAIIMVFKTPSRHIVVDNELKFVF